MKLHQESLKLQAGDIIKMESEIKYLKDVNVKQLRKLEKYEKLVYGNRKQ